MKNYSFLRKAEILAEQIMKRTEDFSDLSPADLKLKTSLFKQQLEQGADLDDILVDAFAVVYKAVQDVYGINLYKVQLMGGYAMHKGDVAQMKTGEGKTLTAIAPAYLNALTGKGVSIITVNEYLAERDARQNAKVFEALGLTLGIIKSDLSPNEKKAEYAKDITYMTNSEVGFDYLRDNMAKNRREQVLRRLNFAIVDEIDSVLIDEARTPLIIAGGQKSYESEYRAANEFVRTLIPEDVHIDKERRTSYLSEEGVWKAQEFFGVEKLFSYKNSTLVHRIQNALMANFIFQREVDYTIRENEVVLIDIFTGRLLEGRTFSEGLHQAIEAKEGTKINPENSTMASVTYQNLFRMFKKLSGMSGTAITEADEFLTTYNMRVIEIPTHRPIIRIDHPDLVHKSKEAKFFSVMARIIEINQKGQPVLVGTRSVQDSEMLSAKLEEINIKHEVLNAKNHSREAEIVANAGQKGAITISTNMAGRGTDIKLGEGVEELGGLFVIGTERSEARRIDDQLIGRAGRQGDIGHSQFFISMEDEVVDRAGLAKFQRILKTLDENPVESKSVQNTLSSAQKKIESLQFDQRKQTLEYDDVMNRQRLIVYNERQMILESKDIIGMSISTLWSFLNDNLENTAVFKDGSFSIDSYVDWVNEIFGEEIIIHRNFNLKEEMLDHVINKLVKYINEIVSEIGTKEASTLIKRNMLGAIDYSWTEQLDKMSKMRQGIRFQQYAQKNPLQLYVLEGNKMFEEYKKLVKRHIISILANLKRYITPKEEYVEREVKDLVL